MLDPWNIEADNPTLPRESRDFLKRILPNSLTGPSYVAMTLALLSEAKEALGDYFPEGVIGATSSDADYLMDPKWLEGAQLRLLKSGKQIDGDTRCGNPVVLHCLAIGKIARALRNSRIGREK